jgi:hypothetical protein
MHFSGSGADDVLFGRAVTALYLTTSGSATVSFDGGTNFMALDDTTHVFLYPNTKTLFFGAGTWSGVGIAS